MAFIQPCSTSVLLRRCRVPLTISLPHPPYQVVRTRSIPRACTLPPKPPSSIAPPSSSPSPSPSSPSSSSSSPPPTTGLVQSTTDLDPRVLFSEFLATFLFVNISLTAAASSAPPVYNAATIASLVASFITVSGAHINPAITLCLLVTNRVSLPRAAAFVPLQLLASVLAAVSVRAVGIPLYPPVIPSVAALPAACVREFLPMFFVAVIVFQTAVATEKEGGVGNKLAAFYIGLAVLACAGTFSTSVFNPARAFGPALVAGALTHHWVFWLPPMLGATIAAFMCEHLFLAPAANREPNSWLAVFIRKTLHLGKRSKNLGLAGIISYGILNTLYYGVAFTTILCRLDLHAGTAVFSKAWLLTWTFSQVTKPLRLALSIALAPFIHRLLVRYKRDPQ